MPPMSVFTEETCLYAVIHQLRFLPGPIRHFSLYPTVGRACSSDVYSVLGTKAGIIFMTVYAIHMNH